MLSEGTAACTSIYGAGQIFQWERGREGSIVFFIAVPTCLILSSRSESIPDALVHILNSAQAYSTPFPLAFCKDGEK